MSHTYTLPQIYDIAFDFRDVPGECDFLLKIAQKHFRQPIRSTLELACGPAYHAREMAKRGLVAHGLDLEPAMIEYTRNLIAREHLNAAIIQGDMRSFSGVAQQGEFTVPGGKYDLIYVLLSSICHLLTNQDILDNLHAVADSLNDNGIYIIAMPHPRDFYQETESSQKAQWTETRDGITVTVDWGGDNQHLDPITEIDDIVVSYIVTANGETTRYDFPERLRRLSPNTFEALVQLCGRFDIVDRLGDYDIHQPLDNSSKSVWYLPVLKKKS